MYVCMYVCIFMGARMIFPGVGKFISAARIFSVGALFSPKKLTIFFSPPNFPSQQQMGY